MALTKKDEERVGTLIDERLKNGGRKALEILPLAGILGVFVALLALAGAGWKYAFSRVEIETQFRTQTTDTLKQTSDKITHVESILGILQAQIAATNYSTIPKQQLEEHRSELANAKMNLAVLPHDTPNFWPVSFQIITLLSQAEAVTVMETVGRSPLSIYSNVSVINV